MAGQLTAAGAGSGNRQAGHSWRAAGDGDAWGVETARRWWTRWTQWSRTGPSLRISAAPRSGLPLSRGSSLLHIHTY